MKHLKKLLIDDVRELKADVICKRPDDGIRALLHMGPFDMLYLDYDLGLGEPFVNPLYPDIQVEFSGYGVACFLETMPKILLPECTKIISANKDGRKAIYDILDRIYNFKLTDESTFFQTEHKMNLFT